MNKKGAGQPFWHFAIETNAGQAHITNVFIGDINDPKKGFVHVVDTESVCDVYPELVQYGNGKLCTLTHVYLEKDLVTFDTSQMMTMQEFKARQLVESVGCHSKAE